MRAYIEVVMVVAFSCGGFVSSVNGQAHNDPTSREERWLTSGLCHNLMLWLRTGDGGNATESDKLIDALLARENLSVRGHLAAAQAANLRGRASQAISILESLVSKYPEHDAEVMHVPVRVLASLWIATYAKQVGDMARAVNAYERTLASLGTVDGVLKDGLSILCNLYLAEIASVHFKTPRQAYARLESIDPGQPKEAGDNGQEPFKFLKHWVAYERQAHTQGESAEIVQWTDAGAMASSPLGAMVLLRYVGITDLPLSDHGGEGVIAFFHTMVNRTIKSHVSRIDASLAKLACAYDYQGKRAFDRAGEYYSSLLAEGSFLSPAAGMALYRMQVRQGRETEAEELMRTLRAKYPGASRAWEELDRGKVDNGSKKGQPPKQ